MNPRINDGGLQLGASCCNRPLDWFGPRDILGGVPISVLGMSALDTTKRGLTLAVGFLAMSADATRPRGVGRVNDVEQHTGKRGLIGKELTQLSKSPRALPGALRVSNRAFRPCTDVP